MANYSRATLVSGIVDLFIALTLVVSISLAVAWGKFLTMGTYSELYGNAIIDKQRVEEYRGGTLKDDRFDLLWYLLGDSFEGVKHAAYVLGTAVFCKGVVLCALYHREKRKARSSSPPPSR